MLTPAKVNLYLNVTGKRSDGYHILDTLIAFIDVYDEIKISPASSFSFNITGEFASLIESDEKNIVLRALNLMKNEYGRIDNVAITLVKNIPVGSGLGGGSSNAAATLTILNDIWDMGLSKEKLSELGLKLGADVPIFLNHSAAFVSGIGDKIENIENLPELYAIIVYPNKPISTKDVFGSFNITEHQKQYPASNGNIQYKQINNPMDSNAILTLLKNAHNDLENTAVSFLPEINEIITNLSALDGCQYARMSGSGSTCFAVFKDKKLAQMALNSISSILSNYWIRLVKVNKEY